MSEYAVCLISTVGKQVVLDLISIIFNKWSNNRAFFCFSDTQHSASHGVIATII